VRIDKTSGISRRGIRRSPRAEKSDTLFSLRVEGPVTIHLAEQYPCIQQDRLAVVVDLEDEVAVVDCAGQDARAVVGAEPAVLAAVAVLDLQAALGQGTPGPTTTTSTSTPCNTRMSVCSGLATLSDILVSFVCIYLSSHFSASIE
jgi:hypothetical protein